MAHAGKNPGFPAAHGCVRVPLAFAKKLFGVTDVGTVVTVVGADGEIASTAPAAEATSSETVAAGKTGLELSLN